LALVSKFEAYSHHKNFRILNGKAECGTKLQKYNDGMGTEETFLDLYDLSSVLISDAVEIHLREAVAPEYNMAPPGATTLKYKWIIKPATESALLWLLFGVNTIVQQKGIHDNFDLERMHISVAKALGSVLNLILVRERSPDSTAAGRIPSAAGLTATRILQVALRLESIGDWRGALNFLRWAETSFKQHSPILDVEVQICLCKFRIDQVYAKTYVDKSYENAENIMNAVLLGRYAVQKILLMMRKEASAMKTSTNKNNPISHTTAPNLDDSQIIMSSSPTPQAALKSLFATPRLRLAAARLALVRALASLGQHVALGATDTSQFPIPLVVETSTNNDNDARSVVVMSLFEEGLHVILSSLMELDGNDMDHGDESRSSSGENEVDMDILEVRSATIAALGELLYCAASANNHQVVPLRTDGEVMTMDEMLQGSMKSLKKSFLSVGSEISKSHGTSVHSWCNHAPRSLVLLQCQTAKDLGKVCDFAHNLRLDGLVGPVVGSNNDLEAMQFLQFAHAVSLHLYGKSHPSTENIQRLRGQASVDESEVNEWLADVFIDVLR